MTRKQDQEMRYRLETLFNSLLNDDGGKSYAPRVSIGQYEKVSCPYCRVGSAEVMIERVADRASIRDIKDPRKCDFCGKLFKVKPRVQLMGEKLK